jgi:phasin family protein
MTQNDTVKIVTDLTNKNLERINALGELNLRAWERMTTRQMDLMGFVMDQTVRSMKLASESKSYTDLIKAQMEMAKDVGERMMEESKTGLKVAAEVRDEYRDWYKQGMAEVAQDMRVPAAA